MISMMFESSIRVWYLTTSTSGFSAWIDSSADRKSTRLNSSHLGISYSVFFFRKDLPHHRDPHSSPTARSSYLHDVRGLDPVLVLDDLDVGVQRMDRLLG